jgi:glutamine cyclotransferase
MKKLVLFVSVLALSLTSCNKDDEGGTSAALEGRWEFTKEGVAANGQEALSDWNHAEGCTKDYTDITATTITDHLFFNEGTDCIEESDAYTYTRSGNTITMTQGSASSTAEIMQLDGSTLKIKMTETFNGQSMDYITVFTRR